ncbi:hypothetical protein [Rhodohalobacter sp.]
MIPALITTPASDIIFDILSYDGLFCEQYDESHMLSYARSNKDETLEIFF